MLLFLLAETFVVVTFTEKQLFEVRLAIVVALQGSIISELKDSLAMSTPETGFVKHFTIGGKPLTEVHGFRAAVAGFALSEHDCFDLS